MARNAIKGEGGQYAAAKIANKEWKGRGDSLVFKYARQRSLYSEEGRMRDRGYMIRG